MNMPGRVFLVGAGPGDPDLLTVKALKILGQAHAVVHDRLVSDEILALAPAGARVISVGKAPGRHSKSQAAINEMLVSLAREGLTVVRLKGGDPYIFGRGSEEAEALRRAGVPVAVIPGITAAQGAAASIGAPLTHRGLATGVRFVTGHCMADRPLDLDWAGLADPDTTLVVYMGVANIELIAARLIEHGLPCATPAMAVANATTPRETFLTSTLERVAADLAAAAWRGPVLFIVGRVVSLRRGRPDATLAAVRPEAQKAEAHG